MIRILLADDQKSIREILRIRLESEPDFQVVGTASDGETALEMAEILRPDIVLIDMEMPNLNGVKATELICQALPEVKVLVLSGHNDDGYINQALRSGAMGYLLKSTPAEELGEAIRFVHRGYSQLGPGVLNKMVSAEPEFSSAPYLRDGVAKLSSPPANGLTKPNPASKTLGIKVPAIPQEDGSKQLLPDDDWTGWGVALWQMLRRRWLSVLAVSATAMAAIVVHTFAIEEPVYKSELWLQVSNKNAVPVTEENQQDIEATEDISKGRLTEVQILRSTPLIGQAIAQLPEQYSKELTVQDVKGGLTIEQSEEGGLLSNILMVDYSDTDPQRVYAVLNALGKTYVSYSTELKRSRAASTIQFIEKNLPATRQKLAQATAELRNFRQRHGMVTPDSYALEIEKTKLRLADDIQKSSVLLNQSKSRVDANRRRLQGLGQDPDRSAIAAVLGQDANYQKLSNQLKDIEIQLSLRQAELSEDHPLVRDLREQRERLLSLRQQVGQKLVGSNPASNLSSDATELRDANTNAVLNDLSKELLTDRTGLEVQQTQLKSLRQAQALVDEQFKQLPRLQETYTELQRQVTLHSTQLDTLLKKLQELKVSAAQETTPWSILEPPALPRKPISPNIPRNLFFGLLFSSAIGLGTALMLERFDRRVRSTKEAQELAGLPLLGTIPHCKDIGVADEGARILRGLPQNQYHRFQEAFRSLALQIQYLNTDCGVKSFSVTSAGTAEGKSTIVLELGQAIARLGLKVLIVDANMHQPSLHALAEIANERGLSNILAENRSWRDCVRAMPVKGLNMLTSGPPPQDSLALLQSKSMTNLLEDWRGCFDYVLIDTPPITGFSDTQGLISKVDCTVFVVGIDRTTRTAVTHATALLKSYRNRLARLVVNYSDVPTGSPGVALSLPPSASTVPTPNNGSPAVENHRHSLKQLL
ncbi:polysaccharide biosynthesis tyrosine autokinase [Altericista sp. CCNU0014]|uniref:polysaccharide biosynthesis tyrosine autokinase n=1 Tax=Altericista sp. CCNU0014 TaxID=3082949 RepID=UPI00384BDB08